jgi:DNA-binding response OmpR family regulator
MSADAHLLVVDDDPDIRDTLSDYLGEAGYRVSTAEDGRAMRRVLERSEIDLVILDLNLPGEDGFSLVTHLRRASHAGIIMLTGSGDRINEVVGLELGADDYISKPCDMRHLAARIRAVLRRAGPGGNAAETEEKKILRFAGWELDVTARELRAPGGEEVPLTTAEFDLLAAFAARPRRVLNRDQLLELLHGRQWDPYDRSIDNLISRLRRKLKDDPKRPRLVKSVRGVGYVFTAEG